MFIKTWFGNYAMARIIPFAFKNHNSILFDIDARLKFFVLCLLNVSILSAPIILCFVFSGILIFCFWQSNINFLNILKKIKYFIILLLIVFASRAISFDDNNFSFQITEHGIKNGFLVSFKFFLIMLTSILFSLTTTPLMLKNAIQWFLKPIFFIPEKRVALMISLSLKFMPIILGAKKLFSCCFINAFLNINNFVCIQTPKKFQSQMHCIRINPLCFDAKRLYLILNIF